MTCFPLQPFVLRVMSLNSEFFKAGQLESGNIKKKLFQSVFPSGKDSQGLYGHLEMGTVMDEPYRKALNPMS